MRYAPTAGYVRSFEIPMQFPNRVRAALQKTVLFSSPFGAVCGAYSIRPYNWVRVILRNTDATPPIGYVRFFEIPMQFPNRIRVVLRKTTPFSSPSGPSVGRMRYAPTIGYVRSYKIPMQFSNWVRAVLQKTILFSSPSGPSVERIQYAPTIGYVRSFKILMQCPNRVRVILRNTDAISQPGTCDPMKYRRDLSTGGAGAFGMWGGGGYRLRGRRA